ncbi:hypothetical protein [Helicobacter pylori]|uniref:hypothetical protein n=1 Tax=Helicobacter pylori TaxID=210 RepID=UPI000347F319|nr:hypothetical protein [Helicobacter pylori]WQS32462.1 hypothetical protein KVC13_05115 [Helicobacter pylori]
MTNFMGRSVSNFWYNCEAFAKNHRKKFYCLSGVLHAFIIVVGIGIIALFKSFEGG